MIAVLCCRHRLQQLISKGLVLNKNDCLKICIVTNFKYKLQNWNTIRTYSAKKDIVTSAEDNNSQVSTTVKTVKETTKTASYGGIILLGVGLTGALFYAVFNELFSGKSANSVYSKSLDRCIDDDRIKMSLGEPIQGYGEETRRGRRRHVSHLLYSQDGVDHLRMKFYLKGSRRKATVHLEMKENDRGKWDYRYMFVQLDEYPGTTFILEDNREEKKMQVPSASLPTLSELQ